MFYWLHIHGGTEITGYGPFDSKEALSDFRAYFADDEQEDGSRKDVDDIPELPSGERDDHESDTWVPIHADGPITILEGWLVYNVEPTKAYAVTGAVQGAFLVGDA